MKVLIVKLSALGDVVQSLPVAMAIREQVPQARVDWLVEAPSAGLLEGHPALDRVLVSPRRRPGGRSLGQVRQWLKGLRQVEYDAVLDLQGLMKSAIFVGLSRGRRKIGFAGGKEPLAAWALTERLPAFNPERHALERYLDLLVPLGLERPAWPQFGLEPQAPSLAKAGALLAGRRAGRPLAVLHPMAKWDSKLWPSAHWARLVRLLHQAGLDLVLSGSAADQGVTQAIAGQAGLSQGLWDLAGVVSLKELAAVLSLANLTVATDTGVMHLAAALGRPVVALFGPTSPGRTGPYGPGHRVLRLDLECGPCFRRNCPDPRCLTGLGPEQVAQAVLSRLDRARP
ncbi:MAG: lipopolysaccharide heptosyltransferase I [Desulfarculus sp.]|nr:lipopolysaccharide heptosyltransferase I [Desulfarculus sp.]